MQLTAFRSLRCFSNTSKPQKHEWMVILPDRVGALEMRRKLRPEHLANLSAYPKDFWLWGGPFLRKPSHDTLNEPLGSMLLASAESADKVLEELKKDIYTREGIWDWEKVQIYPFRSTLRKAM
ncbi:hypothetical protein GQ44DRAFT_633132 [Phaeosphaeriaceae sp. PMI808]|nr:hypothetical protein GQ44DRAFT_633132 [Phaeosphaeriaceae sp. PMI808]